ncbi:hypothetical protein FBU30_006359 [Linnemannia zychae]|nr:hypothetical protein FBU30_006359 [Linnemannia zychae]
MEDDDQEDMVIIQEESNFVTETIIFLTAGGPMLATMAVLKAPLSPPLPIKGILKKHPPTGTLGQSSRVRPNSHNRLVHPIARDDIQMSGMLSATDHRARLETSSPIPSHFARQQHHQHMTPAPKWMSGYPNKLFHSSGYGAYNEKTLSNSPMMSSKLDLPIKLDNLPFLQGGGALPPDFMPGVQSNIYQNHGGESSQGQGADYQMNMNPSTLYHDAPPLPATIAVSAAYVYQHQYSRVSSNQIYGGYSNNNGHDLNSSTVQDPYGYASYSYRTGSWNDVSGSMRMMHIGNGRYRSSSVVLNGNGINHRPRTIGFTDKIEIIPAYRKSEYNRQSDKYATFKNLTPDLKCEIRDELNTYKMREMAVHIESMGNTAFH